MRNARMKCMFLQRINSFERAKFKEKKRKKKKKHDNKTGFYYTVFFLYDLIKIFSSFINECLNIIKAVFHQYMTEEILKTPLRISIVLFFSYPILVIFKLCVSPFIVNECVPIQIYQLSVYKCQGDILLKSRNIIEKINELLKRSSGVNIDS